MPLDALGQKLRLGRQLLRIILTEVRVRSRGLMKSKDIIRGLQLGDCNQANLQGGCQPCLSLTGYCLCLPFDCQQQQQRDL